MDALFASPMKRVQQTLAAYANNGAPPATVLPDLREVDFGDWTGHGWEAVQTKFGASSYSWIDQLDRGGIANAENIAAYQGRVATALATIRQSPAATTLAVFCHGGVIRMLLALLLVAWLALAVFVTWQPFDLDWELAGPRLAAVSFVPFADLWQGNELIALHGVIEKLVLYLPLGAILTSWQPAHTRFAWLPGLVMGFLIALVLEAGQLVLSSRTAALSDVYVETAGALLGGLITQRIRDTEMVQQRGHGDEAT